MLFACSGGNDKVDNGTVYGEAFDTSGAISMVDLAAQMSGKSVVDCKVKGTIAEVCQSEGCWFTIRREGGEPVTVRMKDHAFTVPKNISGKTAYFNGQAVIETVSVETMKDYAKDAGKNDAEVEAIHEPGIELVVEAKGVILQ